jgi:hypothetical protein
MSVILDALERAKQERARRKENTRPPLASAQIAEIERDSPDPAVQSKPVSLSPTPVNSTGGNALLVVVTISLVLILAGIVGIVSFLLLERNRPVAVTSAASPVPAAAVTPTPPIPDADTANPSQVPIAQPLMTGTTNAELPISGTGFPAQTSLQGPVGLHQEPGLPSPAPMLPKLGSIICDERGCTAMLDGRISRTGDRVGDYQVMEVTQDLVTLQDARGRHHQLSMRR